MQRARKEQLKPEWLERYHARAGVEGTLSQAVRGHGLRHCRYLGLAKTSLQETAIAAGVNILRVSDWLAGRKSEKTRTSRFLRLGMAT
jgi:transposase